jgi:two-component system sensor histidine kinase UhpB
MSRIDALRKRLMRLATFHKILYANLAVVAFGAIAGTLITVWHVRTYPNDIHYELIALFIVGGVVISYVINRWAIKTALHPLDRLQEGVNRVRAGESGVRIDMGTVTDERFDRLAETFNAMLVRLEREAVEKQRLGQRLINAQEQERMRLARDLHDEAGQSLTSLLVRLRLLERAHAPEDAQRHVEELRQLTITALDDVHRVAVDLRPTILDDLGLGPALEWRIDELNKGETLTGQITVSGMDRRLPREMELVLYRVGQEALNNVQRHARARNVWLRLTKANGAVTLEVEDDGVGFDASAAEKEDEGAARHSGLGLAGMRERISAVDGEMTIVSRPGAGTTVRVRIQTEPRRIVNG